MKIIWKFIIIMIMSMFSFNAQAHHVDPEYYVFSGNGNKRLAENIAYHLKTPLRSAQIEYYGDGEIDIKINENVKNKRVFIIDSLCKGSNKSMNDTVMELYLLARTLKKHGAKTIIAVIPYLGYTRQDRKDFNFAPILTSDIAVLLENSGIDDIITVDLHNIQIKGYFQNIAIDNLHSAEVIAPYFSNVKLNNPIVVALHSYGLLRAEKFSKALNTLGVKSNLGMAIRQPYYTGNLETNIIGKVKNRDVILIDDLSDTGTTVADTAKTLKKLGALNVFAIITHPVLSGNAIELIIESPDIKELITTDTIPIFIKLPSNIKQFSVASILADEIRKIHDEI